jgi:hypothetical protein
MRSMLEGQVTELRVRRPPPPPPSAVPLPRFAGEEPTFGNRAHSAAMAVGMKSGVSVDV